MRSINSMLASLNSFLAFLGWHDLKVKTLKLQQQVYCPEEKELTPAGVHPRVPCGGAQTQPAALSDLANHLQHRHPDQLRYIIVEAAKHGEAVVNCKAKTRTVFSHEGAETKTAPLCCGAGNQKWDDFCDPNRQTHQSNKYLARDEILVSGSGRQPREGVSAQSASLVCPCILRHRKGHCQAGRHPRSQQH